MSRFIAAVVQMRSTTRMSDNLSSLDTLVRQAAGEGATYIQTPEMTGLVQKNRSLLLENIFEQDDDPVFAAASGLARELGVTLHIGSTPIRYNDSKAVNRALLFAPDGVLIDAYDKIHMFDVDLDHGESWRESALYQPGRRAVLTTTMDEVRIGLSICYDIRFPHLYRSYAEAGADMLTAPACFTRQTGRAHWHVLQRSRAIETGSFMISAAQGGDHEDGRSTFGHSIIVGPWGDVLAEVEGEAPGIAIAEIDTAQVAEARRKVPNLKNTRAFDLQTGQDRSRVA